MNHLKRTSFFYRVLLALFMLMSASCSRTQETPQPIAGIFAVTGTVHIESALAPEFQRTAKAGMGLFFRPDSDGRKGQSSDLGKRGNPFS